MHEPGVVFAVLRRDSFHFQLADGLLSTGFHGRPEARHARRKGCGHEER
jgi:hypothetical protein